jgi:hypothetical protein
VRMVGPSMLKPPPTKPLSPKEERAVLAPMERENELKQRRKAHLKAKKAKSSFRWPRSYSEDVLAFAERFETEWKKTIEGIIGAGKVVQEAKDELGYGKYGAFLEKIELSERIAVMLMTIARNKDLSNPKNFSGFATKIHITLSPRPPPRGQGARVDQLWKDPPLHAGQGG